MRQRKSKMATNVAIFGVRSLSLGERIGVRQRKSQMATNVAIFRVCSLSLWERVGVRASARTNLKPDATSHP